LTRGTDALAALDPGGLEVLDVDLPRFRAALTRENHTLKRALTDPRLLAGIGNAYSDEILHRARLSPVKLTRQLADDELARLHAAAQATLREWTERLRAEAGDGFPEKVTAFRDGMAVHGRYRRPCPDCGSPVQRIVYAENETNYCARCQTGGVLLADRSLSRLLHDDWPRRLEELEEAAPTPSPPRRPGRGRPGRARPAAAAAAERRPPSPSDPRRRLRPEHDPGAVRARLDPADVAHRHARAPQRLEHTIEVACGHRGEEPSRGLRIPRQLC